MSTPDAEIQKLFSRSEELLDMVRKSREFTEQLAKENERLRLENARLEKEVLDSREKAQGTNLDTLVQANASLREKLDLLEKRLKAVEEENEDFANKYLEITQQNDSLTNLYVASYQLHCTLDPREVMEIVKEILINLVGAEEFAIFLLDKKTGELTPAAGEGVLPKLASRELRWDEGVLERVIASGDASYHNGEALPDGPPLACVPLKIKQDVVGAIVIFKLFVQKAGLALMDREILNLLARQAATAIVSSRLHDDAQRKLKTIEGFIGLLRPRLPFQGEAK